ncbi:helix-turn-helix domain-containing protein [Oribacterium sp. P6A1]|uniref:helix-turn-helix domain-containing protein n=1 Tax=Oribacterium sp. P6A1 TaxID=1410612 RepID=UPI00055C64F3|nr:helix-turn-helix transcriptional regulator [Oribacterium sp. P6A1]
MTISERIFEKMDELNMTQKTFCNLTGIRQTTVSEWKRNNTNPSTDKVMVICSVLKVSPEWLLSGTEVKGEYRNQVDWFVVDKKCELGNVIIEYNKMNSIQRARLMGYIDSLKEMYKKR